MNIVEQAVADANESYFTGPKWESSWKRHAEYMRAENAKLKAALESLLAMCDRLKLLGEVSVDDADVILKAEKALGVK